MYGIVIVTALCGYLVAFPAIRKKGRGLQFVIYN